MPKWQGPAKITEVNDTKAWILLSNGKSKVINIMHLKKFFLPTPEATSETVSPNDDLNFNSEPAMTGPVTRAMKKLMDHKNAAQLAIKVLCNLSKEHCSMCELEQDSSDNPLLLDPNFACQYIKERHSRFINKQSTCAKCKVQIKTRWAFTGSSSAK